MLKSKTILIAGASGSIGQAIAMECAKKHAQVILGYHGNQSKAEILAEQIKSQGGQASCLKLNMESASELDQAFEQHKDQLDSLYGLVNASGINVAGPLISLASSDIERQINVNLTGAIHLTRLACKNMIRKRSGSIVHLGSVSAHRMIRGHSAYSAAKAGLEGFVKALAAEVAKRQIRVNCVLPGPVMSEMLKQSMDATGDNPSERVPFNRLITAEEVAKTVRFLLSSDASGITGAMIPVDGGYLLL